MGLLDKIDKLLIGDQSGATTTGNVATNTAKGHIDIVGGDCPEGYRWCPIEKDCIPDEQGKGKGQRMARGKGYGPMSEKDKDCPEGQKW